MSDDSFGRKEHESASGTAAPEQRKPVSAEHSYIWHPNHGNYGIVECRCCGVFRKYALVGFKPAPPKEPCYGR